MAKKAKKNFFLQKTGKKQDKTAIKCRKRPFVNRFLHYLTGDASPSPEPRSTYPLS